MQYRLKKRKFTLIEIMVSMGVFLILLTLLLNFFSGTRQVWKTLRERNDSFEKSRVAMDIITDLMTTSVADNSEIGFWTVESVRDDKGNVTSQGSCTFITRTTRKLSGTGSNAVSELDNYYLVKIYAENGDLKLKAQRVSNYFTSGSGASGAPEPTGTPKVIVDGVSELSFKQLVDQGNGVRGTAIEVTLCLFDSKANYDKYVDAASGMTDEQKQNFKAAHEYVFTRVISFDDIVGDTVYEVKNGE